MRCKRCESTSGALDTWWLVTKPPRYDYRFSSRRLERESERKGQKGKAEISGIGGYKRSRDLGKGRAVMDGRDGPGWHVAGGKGVPQDKTIINQIMLRFRPIAPKPAAAGSSSGQTSTEAFASKRVKRKYIRARKNNSINRSDKPAEAAVDPAGATTLQLMPGKSGSGDFTGGGSWCAFDSSVAKISEDNRGIPWMKMNRSVAAAGEDRAAAVESWVTVESVTDTCMYVRGLGCTDVEKWNSLEKDTCPGFISDGSNRVMWVNNAFKSLVVPEIAGAALIDYAGQPRPDPEVVVWLVTKAELPDYYAAFSCRVRVQYYTWQQREKCSKTVPCDVWRMECGLAWRLDTKAALSLGL